MADEESSEDANLDFTAYLQLISILNTQYNELTQARTDRRKMAEGRLKLLMTSIAIFTGILSQFLTKGIFSSNAWSITITLILATLTTMSVLATIYFLWRFLTSEEINSLDFSDNGWGSGAFTSNPESVDRVLNTLTDCYSSCVKLNKEINDERAKIFDKSTLGLIIYFLLLSLLTIAIGVVKF